jgi:DNA polymerase V
MSRFRQNPEEVYSGAASWRLPFPTSYTSAMVSAARELLGRIYKAGFVYHKAGVMLTDIVPEAERQQNLMHWVDGDRRLRLMGAVDSINRRHGRRTVLPLAAGVSGHGRCGAGGCRAATRPGSTR